LLVYSKKTRELEKYSHLVKIPILGYPGAGKTCIIRRFVYDTFSEEHHHTAGVEFFSRVSQVNGVGMNILLFDAVGAEERYRPAIFRNAKGVIVVFDITQMSSFQVLPRYFEQIQKYAELLSDTKVLLLGTKSDSGENRQVPFAQAKEYAEQSGWKFCEVSSKEDSDTLCNILHSFIADITGFGCSLKIKRADPHTGIKNVASEENLESLESLSEFTSKTTTQSSRENCICNLI
jgi:Rab family, other